MLDLAAIKGANIISGNKNFTSFFSLFKDVKSISDAGTVLSMGFESIAAAIGVSAGALGGFLAVAAGIAGVIALVDLLNVSFEETAQAVEKAQSDYNNTTKEIGSIQRQINDNTTKMDTLRGKGGLTLIEQRELEQLETSNQLLNRQLSIKQKLADWQGQQASDAVVRALNNQNFASERPDYDYYSELANGNINYEEGRRYDIISDTERKQEQLNKLLEKQAELYEQQNAVEPGTLAWKNVDAQIETTNSSISVLTDSIGKNLNQISDWESSLYKSNGTVRDGAQETVKRINDLYESVFGSDLDDAQKNIDSLLSRATLAPLVEEAKRTAKELNGLSVEQFEQQFPDLSTAAKATGIQLEDLVNTINSLSGTVNLDYIRDTLKEDMRKSIVDDRAGDQVRRQMEDVVQGVVDGFDDEELRIAYRIYLTEDTSDWSADDWRLSVQEETEQAAKVAEQALPGYEQLKTSVEAVNAVHTNLNATLADGGHLSAEAYAGITQLAGGEEALAGIVDATNGNLIQNAEALEELINASERQLRSDLKLSSAMEKMRFHELVGQLTDLVTGTNEYDSATVRLIDDLQRQIAASQLQLQQYTLLQHQLQGAAEGFDKITNAQQIDDMFNYTDELSSSIANVFNLAKEGRFGRNELMESLRALVPEDILSQFTDAGDQINAGIEYLQNQLARYYTLDNGNVSITSGNTKTFITDALKKQMDSENPDLGTVLTGSLDDFDLNPQIASLEQFADAMGMTKTAALGMISAIGEFVPNGKDIFADLTTESIEGSILVADREILELDQHLAELGKTGSLSTEDVAEYVGKIAEQQAALKELGRDARENIAENMTIDDRYMAALEEYREAIGALSEPVEGADYDSLVSQADQALQALTQVTNEKAQLEAPTEVTISVAIDSIESEISQAQEELDRIATYADGDYKVKVGVELEGGAEATQADVDALVQQIEALNGEKAKIEAYVGIDKDDAVSALQEIESFTIKNKNFTVSANTAQTEAQLQKIRAILDSLKDKVINVVTVYSKRGQAPNLSGTAQASGSPGLKHDEHGALVGELGRELVVDPRSGQYYSVGDTGAEMVDLPKGAIVFNHRQTEELLRTGHTGRGRALAGGTVKGPAHGFTWKDPIPNAGSSAGSKSSGVSTGGSAAINTDVVQIDQATVEMIEAYNSGMTLEEQQKLRKANEDYMRQFGGVGANGETQFEIDYKKYKHDLDMDLISTKDFFEWLDKAWQDAFEVGMIGTEDAAKHQLEVWNLRKEWMQEVRQERENAIAEAENWFEEAARAFTVGFQNETYKAMADAYQELLDEAKKLGVDVNRAIYGNINLDTRQILNWSPDTIQKFSDALASWGMTAEDVANSYSTVLGSVGNYDGVDIAFSPILQTETGPVLLDADTVDRYIFGLIEKAGADWTPEQLMILDTEGLEQDGVLIKNLLADIGETAEWVSQVMHFGGATGAVAGAYDEIAAIAGESEFGLSQFFGDPSRFDDTKKYAAWIVKYYEQLLDIVDAQEQEFRDRVDDNGNRLYPDTSDEIAELEKLKYQYRDSLIEAVSAIYEKAKEHRENLIGLNEVWLDNAIDDRDYDKVTKFTETIAEQYARLQEELHEQAEFFRSQGYSDTSKEVSELSNLWWEYEEKRINASVEAWDKIVDASHNALDELRSVYDTLHKAADEYAQYGGYISVDAFQEILKLGPQYMQYLEDENGLLTITDERIHQVIAAKTEELAIDNALAYVDQLRAAQMDGDTQRLNELLFATKAASGATWELVYANLSLLDLSEEQAAAARHNIDMIRALASNAQAGVSVTMSKTSEDLKEMQGAMDDIIKYTMDMLKSRVDKQIDKLKEMKDAFKDIIDLRKEALKAAKKEADYQDKVADKVKELAKLQERITALSRDDSRAAGAERAKLEDDMVKLQKELADEQADYARDAQENQLDDQLKAYEDEKDSEIKLLEESISSTEKLHRKALEYIRDNWGTLKDELIAWNYDVGNEFERNILKAWDTAYAAAQRYGDFLTALKSISEELARTTSSIHYNEDGTFSSSHNDVVGTTDQNGSSAVTYSNPNTSAVTSRITRMKANSAHWREIDQNAALSSQDKNSIKRRLESENRAYADEIEQIIGDKLDLNSKGEWIIRGTGKRLYDVYRVGEVYHSGGIVGGQGTLKQDETFAKLQKGEMVLNGKHQAALDKIMEFSDAIVDRFMSFIGTPRIPSVFGTTGGLEALLGPQLRGMEPGAVNSVTFGDVIINGASGDTVEQHREINRKFTNDILKFLDIRK